MRRSAVLAVAVQVAVPGTKLKSDRIVSIGNFLALGPSSTRAAGSHCLVESVELRGRRGTGGHGRARRAGRGRRAHDAPARDAWRPRRGGHSSLAAAE